MCHVLLPDYLCLKLEIPEDCIRVFESPQHHYNDLPPLQCPREYHFSFAYKHTRITRVPSRDTQSPSSNDNSTSTQE